MEMKISKRIRIGVGLPAYGGKLSAEHAHMWLTFGHALAASEARFELGMFQIVDVCGIDRARNKLVQDALEHRCDWLLMIDADTWVEDGRDLLAMISAGDRADGTIVGAAVPRRTLERDRRELMVYGLNPTGSLFAWTDDDLRAVVWEVNQDLFPVQAMATACIALNLHYVQFLDQPYFKFTATESEDLDFCRRIRDCRGGQVKIGVDGRPDPDADWTTWNGFILVDKRVTTYHMNRAQALKGLASAPLR